MLSKFFSFLLFAALGLAQTDRAPDPIPILKSVEKRYNSATTLEATFTQTLIERGRTRAIQKGTVYLSKPKRTRWQYTSPAGDWFLSDGNYAYDYDSAKNTVERIRMKETEDMRIPLAFLLGTLDFQKDFGTFHSRREGDGVYIAAKPKNDKLLFTEVAMLIAPDSSIRRVSITGQDFSIMEFVLEGEKRNIPLNASLFRFAAPPGARVIDVSQ
jgi:outer membrane lipoprotein carrier protein